MTTIRTKKSGSLSLMIQYLDNLAIQYQKPTKSYNTLFVSGEIDRIHLREFMESKKFNFQADFIEINGRVIWSHNQILAEAEKMSRKNSIRKMTNYFFDYLSVVVFPPSFVASKKQLIKQCNTWDNLKNSMEKTIEGHNQAWPKDTAMILMNLLESEVIF